MTQSTTSHIEIFNIQTQQRRCIADLPGVFEAPNWSRNGAHLLLNQEGLLFLLSIDGGAPEILHSGFADHCNNDHGYSPDGTQIVISHHDSASHGESQIYLLPSQGGTPQKVTDQSPSYWHGWSPDGQRLAYVASRNGSDYKIYDISISGGEERQLSFGAGHDDGPDYSHDGQHIYFNRFRDGRMQIWRMNNDGNDDRQIVYSEGSDWFPHPCPNGEYFVFLRYIEDQGSAHPFGRDVQLMCYNLATKEVTALTENFFGGQGTINVPSWSPNGLEFAFVSYSQ